MATPTVTAKQRTLPSDLSQVLCVTRVEFHRNLRRKRLVALLIVVVLVCVAVLVIPPAYGIPFPSEPVFGVYRFSQFFLGFIDFLAILLAVFFGGDTLVSEFHGRTGYSVFPNPVKRSALFLGKVFASLLASVLILAVFYLFIAGAMLGIYGTVPVEMLFSFSFAVLYVSAALSVAFLISATMRTTTSAMILTFVLFLFVFNIISGVFIFVKIRPEWFLTFQAGIISGFMAGPFPEFYPTDIDISTPGFSITIFQPTVAIGIVVTLTWMIVCFILAYFFFNRREMLG